MNAQSFFPSYFSIEDILVSQEKVECKVNTKQFKMGFLDGDSETDLQPGRTVNLPLWFVRYLKVDNPYFTVNVPDIYKNVHKAVCEAEATHIELGKLHPYFYEYGRHLALHDQNKIVGKIVFETMRQRARNLLDISKNTQEDSKPEHRLDYIEQKLYEGGVRTNTLYTNWQQMKSHNIAVSELVHEHSKKRKREEKLNDSGPSSEPSRKRPTL